MEKFYITTAIPYASRVPHIGNTYEAVLTDAIARYKKLRGFDVFMLTGTDEHGQKVQKLAEEEGITPKEHADRVTDEIKAIWAFMGVEYDKFIRTTDEEHETRVEKIFNKLYGKGDIYKRDYEGWYCTPCESFYTDSQIVMKDGVATCPDCGEKLERSREEAYYFRLSAYADRLARHFEEHPEFLVPELRRNEMINNFIKPGLQDFCVTRSTFDWGVKVPFDPKHVVYVWIDALSNYITALGYDPDGNHGELFRKYWPADVHVIGKDIVRFHTIYWPALLMALDVELPKQVFGHPWFLFGADKMSKSKGNVIYARELVELFGLDAIRYYLLSEMAYSADSSITYDLIISHYNSDLANILGNLVNRTVAMVQKYFGGTIPERGMLTDVDRDLISAVSETPARYAARMDAFRLSDAVAQVWDMLRRCNKYIDETTPWTLAKGEDTRERLGSVLYNLVESIRFAAVLLRPLMPETADKIFAQLGQQPSDWDSLSAFGFTVPGGKTAEPSPLFVRIDEESKHAEIEALHEREAKAAEVEKLVYPPLEGEIGIEDFAKSDLRVAEVLACEPVAKSDKLLKLSVDLGFEKRQVVSGIAKWYKPDDLVGKKVILVANLKPVKLRGELSEGMILAATKAAGEGKPEEVVVMFADPSIPSGSKIR